MLSPSLSSSGSGDGDFEPEVVEISKKLPGRGGEEDGPESWPRSSDSEPSSSPSAELSPAETTWTGVLDNEYPSPSLMRPSSTMETGKSDDWRIGLVGVLDASSTRLLFLFRLRNLF